MSLILKLLVAGGLIGGIAMLFQRIERIQQEAEIVATDSGTTASVFGSVLPLYGAIVILVVLLAILFATTVFPAIAGGIGNLVYSPNEQVEKNPHAEALAAIAQGDYEEAVEAYERSLVASPEDTHALSEIARIHCEKLQDCMTAASRLETALSREWEPSKAAFLTFRLVDIYWNYLGDATRSKQLLEQIMAGMPGTTHSANATHRLRDIEHAVFSGHIPGATPIATSDQVLAQDENDAIDDGQGEYLVDEDPQYADQALPEADESESGDEDRSRPA